jgi:nucleoside triphosphate diphosphatase
MTIQENYTDFNTLVDIIARLRGPQGCPWDRKQTHLSLKSNLLEECYEVIEAIDEENSEKLQGELGDLLMLILSHAQIASESGDFDIRNVLQGIITKLINRHPHVFGEAKAKDAQEVILNWEELKKKERGGSPLLSSLPQVMPSLAYSQAMQRRVARVGFDWKAMDDVIDKLAEEVNELRQSADHRERVQEFGDLLFSLANVARWMNIEPENALRATNQRFYRRFCYMEEVCQQRGISLEQLSLEEQDELWKEAKRSLPEKE